MRVPEIPDSLRHIIAEMSPLWPLVSMRIGGPARWLAQPRDEGELQEILSWIESQQLPHGVLGAGTNVLFWNEGFPGVVVSTRKLKGIRIDETSVTASCGENLASLAQRMNRAGLSGMEWACGIPGTIGGAVVMNAGAQDGDIATVLESVRILTPQQGARKLLPEELDLGYRTSALLTGKFIRVVLEATFRLRPDDPEHCLRRERDVLKMRQRTQPTGASSGCIFKNPDEGPTAGELLDRASCKGMRVGFARVSDVHANFILNEGENNSDDVLELIEQMRTRVKDSSGVMLSLEVEILIP